MSDNGKLDRIDILLEKVSKIEELLTGNGDPGKGLVVRVDRLEQSEARRSLLIGGTITASVGAIATSVWAKLTGNG